MSSVSPAVVLSAPVMVFAALHCMEQSLLVIDMDPFSLPVPPGLKVGVYQTSAPYVKLGTNMVKYSCLVSLGLRPFMVLDSLHI